MDTNDNRKRVTSSYLKRQKERQIAFQDERYQRLYPTRNFTISPDLRTNTYGGSYGIYGVNLDGSDKPDNHQMTERQTYHRDDTLDEGIEHRDIRHLNMLFPRLRHVGIVVDDPSSGHRPNLRFTGRFSIAHIHRTGIRQ